MPQAIILVFYLILPSLFPGREYITFSIDDPIVLDSVMSPHGEEIGRLMRDFVDSLSGTNVLSPSFINSTYLKEGYKRESCPYFPCEMYEGKILSADVVVSSSLFRKGNRWLFTCGLFLPDEMNYYSWKFFDEDSKEKLEEKIVNYLRETVSSLFSEKFLTLRIALRVNPDDAEVFLDGRKLEPVERGKYFFKLETTSNRSILIRKEKFRDKIINVHQGQRGFSFYSAVLVPEILEREEGYGYLKVETEPEGAVVLIDGKEMGGRTPLTISRVPAGKHFIEINKEGYPPLISEFILKDMEVKWLKLKLEERKFQLKIITDPPGSSVFLNYQKVGVSPFYFKSLTQSAYLVGVRELLYEPEDRIVFLEGDREEVFSMKKRGGKLIFPETFSKLDIYVDGRKLLYGNISHGPFVEGKHIVYIEGKGVVPYLQVIDVKGGEEKIIVPALETNYAFLNIDTQPHGMRVKINDEEIGVTPLKNIQFPAGTHTLLIYDAEKKYRDIREELRLEKNELKEIFKSMEKIYGSLNVHANPPDSKIYLNGKIIGTGSVRDYKVEVGKHELLIFREGFIPLKKVIEVKGDETINLAEGLQDLKSSEIMKREKRRQRTVSSLFLGFSGAGFILTGISYGVASKYSEDAENFNDQYLFTTSPQKMKEYKELALARERKAKRWNLAGHILLGASVITSALGTYYLLKVPEVKIEIPEFVRTSLQMEIIPARDSLLFGVSLEW